MFTLLRYYRRVMTIAAAIPAAYPTARVSPDAAVEHALAAVAAETPDFPAELLVAVARRESGFDSASVSRRIGPVGIRRTTGAWRSTARPRGATGNFYCGATQATAQTWAECLRLRDVRAAYASTAAELAEWQRRTRSATVTLGAYNGGNKCLARGKCRKYPATVLAHLRVLERAIAKQQGVPTT